MTNNGICIIEGCEREVKPKTGNHGSRGLCNRCRAYASKAVLKDLVTRDQLVEMGLMLPTKSREHGTAFSRALAKAQEGK